MSRLTNAQAPITEWSPIVTPLAITDCGPMWQLAPIVTGARSISAAPSRQHLRHVSCV